MNAACPIATPYRNDKRPVFHTSLANSHVHSCKLESCRPVESGLHATKRTECIVKTTKIVGLTVAGVLGLVLLVCAAMWSHVKKHADIWHGHHAAQMTSVAKP